MRNVVEKLVNFLRIAAMVATLAILGACSDASLLGSIQGSNNNGNGGGPGDEGGSLSFTTRTTAQGLPSDVVKGLVISGADIYAATTGGLGISNDGGASFSARTTAHGLGSNSLTSVFVSGAEVLVSSYTSGISVSSTGVSFLNKNYLVIGANEANRVNQKGVITYVSMDGGLSLSSDGTSFVTRTTAHGLGHNNVRAAVHETNADKLYVATQGGLSVGTGNYPASFSNRTTAHGLASNNVFNVTATPTALYVATAGGLSISSDGGVTFASRTTTHGLGSNFINAICTGAGQLAVATAAGLSISTDAGASFTHYSYEIGLGTSGLPNIYDCHIDGTGKIYAATAVGLAISQ